MRRALGEAWLNRLNFSFVRGTPEIWLFHTKRRVDVLAAKPETGDFLTVCVADCQSLGTE